MKYIDVKWLHSSAEYPIRLFSELDSEGYENRKLEFFSNGNVSYASKFGNSGDTILSEKPIPSLTEINLQKEFEGVESNAASFEKLWSQYVGTHVTLLLWTHAAAQSVSSNWLVRTWNLLRKYQSLPADSVMWPVDLLSFNLAGAILF